MPYGLTFYRTTLQCRIKFGLHAGSSGELRREQLMTSALEVLPVPCRRPRWAANALRSRAPCSFVWCSPRTACYLSTVCTSSRRTPTNGTWPQRWWDCSWKRPSPSTANVDKSGNGQSNFKTGFNAELNLFFQITQLCCVGQAHSVTLVYFNGFTPSDLLAWNFSQETSRISCA